MSVPLTTVSASHSVLGGSTQAVTARHAMTGATPQASR